MTTRLITFGLSHYCEKARWVLDWHGVAFDEVGWPPGLHIALARRLGAASSALPILVTDGALIQDSDRIIDWVEQRAANPQSTLAPGGDADGAAELIRRANGVLGIHVRRLFYSELLPHQPHLVRPWLLMNTTPYHRLIGRVIWPAVRKRMIQAMDTPPEAAPDSRARIERELDWLDELLSDGRRFLVGDRFSRVDLTVAALLAPFARPAEAMVHSAMPLPAALQRDVDGWRERPAMTWVRDMYAHYRQRSA